MPKDSKTTLTPKLRFPEFQDEPGWQSKRLDEVCTTITQGGTPDTSVAEYWNGDVCWLTPAEMGKSDTPFVDTTERKITEEGLRNCSSTLLPINTVILSTRAPIGHLAINRVPMAINQGCKGLIPSSEFDFRFLYFHLLASRHRLNDLGSGNTFKELSGSALKTFSTTFPRQAEQQKIAECLSTLDELIEAESRKLDALKDHKKGLMQQLFPREGETRPRLRFPEFRDTSPWRPSVLGKEASILKGKGISKSDIDPDGTQPCIRYGELYTAYGAIIGSVVSRTKLPAEKLFLSKANDVIIPSSGETKIDIATASCVLIDNVALGGDLNVIRTRLNGPFLSYYLNGPKRFDIAKIAQGDTVVHLYPNQLEKLEIALPSQAEQQKIAECLSTLDDQIAAQSEKLEILRAHKRGLMQQLFPNPSDFES